RPPRPPRTLRPEGKGQAGASPDRARAISCTVRAVTGTSVPVLIRATAIQWPAQQRRAQDTAVVQERNCVMSIKSKVLAAAAALTMAGGLGTAGTLSASAATPQCSQSSPTCLQIFSAKFGTPDNPGFIETVFLGIPEAAVP